MRNGGVGTISAAANPTSAPRSLGANLTHEWEFFPITVVHKTLLKPTHEFRVVVGSDDGILRGG
jgi:hypothetical protein